MNPPNLAVRLRLGQQAEDASWRGFCRVVLRIRGLVPKWSGAKPVIAPIAPVTVQSLGRAEGTAPRALVEVPPAVAPERDARERSAPRASVVAFAPAAMSALIEAQEHMAGDATPTDRSDTAQKIDHILARLADAPPARPVTQVAGGGFSLRMLVAARQQLRGTYA
jgi:hypothetical protein